MWCYFERSHGAEKDVEDRIKNIVPNLSYDFLKIAIRLYSNYIAHENLKLRLLIE